LAPEEAQSLLPTQEGAIMPTLEMIYQIIAIYVGSISGSRMPSGVTSEVE
jgi:hypothetical protein